jgi:hypothetical protein
VETFERAESVQFLRNRIPEIEGPIAEALAETLGDLPLALTQAAAYIEDSGLSPVAYLELFRERRQELLRRGIPADYPEAVATTWEVSFQQLETASPEAAALLRLCAFLAPEDIPLDLFSTADPLALRDAVAAARQLSLLDVRVDALYVHRLVQAAMRERCTKKKKNGNSGQQPMGKTASMKRRGSAGRPPPYATSEPPIPAIRIGLRPGRAPAGSCRMPSRSPSTRKR